MGRVVIAWLPNTVTCVFKDPCKTTKCFQPKGKCACVICTGFTHKHTHTHTHTYTHKRYAQFLPICFAQKPRYSALLSKNLLLDRVLKYLNSFHSLTSNWLRHVTIYSHIYASESEVICNFELLDYNTICAISTVYRLYRAYGHLGGKSKWGKLEKKMKVLLIKENKWSDIYG